MKKLLVCLCLAALPCLAAADEMTPQQIKETLTKNDMASLIPLVEKGALLLDEKNTTVNIMRLISNRAAYENKDAQTAKYWYRGMPPAEVNALVSSNYSGLNWDRDDYVGIAPQYSYSQGYLAANKPGAVAEFGTDRTGWLYQDWSVAHPCTIKAEGGGTYGLGHTGSTQSCNTGPKAYKPAIRGLGQIFNPWMANNTVTTKIVFVLANRKL